MESGVQDRQGRPDNRGRPWLAGKIDYPVMVERCRNHGQEQLVAREMMSVAAKILGKQRPELWLLDALYFNENTIAIVRRQGAQVLFKFKDADYRTVTADADNLFRHFGGDEEQTGWDAERECRWTLRKTLDRFLGYPVQVVEFIETYPKRKRDRTVISWIVTTDLQLRWRRSARPPTSAADRMADT